MIAMGEIVDAALKKNPKHSASNLRIVLEGSTHNPAMFYEGTLLLTLRSQEDT